MWLEQIEREERGKRGGRRWGRSSRALRALEKTWVFYLKGGGALKGCGQREDGSDVDFKLIILNYFTEEKQKSQAKVTNWESNTDICTLLCVK